MSIKVISDEELNHLYRALDAVLEEFQAIDETTDHVFTTGADEMIEESIEIITGLKRYSKADYDIALDADDIGC